MKRDILIGLVLAAVIITGSYISAPPVSALTNTEIQTQIQQLLKQISELKVQVGQLNQSYIQGSDAITNAFNVVPVTGQGQGGTHAATSSPAWAGGYRICANFPSYLSEGARGDGVRDLQEFLAGEKFLTVSPTGFFGPMTREALKKWQVQYKIVTVGASTTPGWGNFGPRTIAALKLRCGGGNSERFSATPMRGPAPLTVTFKTNVTLTNPAMVADAGDYKIAFGDGSEQVLTCTSTTGSCPGPQQAIHTYASDGTYNATLVHYGYYGVAGNNQETVGKVTIQVGAIACTKEYKPVCGSKPIVCITTPCNPVPQTYGNRCMMEADGATFLSEGACQDPNNKAPVISGFSGPTTLTLNQSGTWSVQASDPENGTLSYRIVWGDEYTQLSYGPMSSADASFVQNTTFAHTYYSAGTYTVKITVRDPLGATTQTTATVKVGGQAVFCTADAMLCPDGSYVGRTGPNCQFVCPTN